MTGGAPTAVLLHGQPDTRASWWPVKRRLSGVRVLDPDRPGYGTNREAPTDFGGNVGWLMRVLDQAEVDRAVLAGHSWAAGIALLAAARHPDRVAGLALVAPVGPHCLLLLDRVLAARVAGDVATYVGLRLGARWWRQRTLADLTGHLDPSDVDGARRELDAQFSRPVWRSFLVEQRALVHQLPMLDGAVSTVDCKVRVVAGTEDRVIPRHTVEALGQRLSSARVSWVDGAGHHLPLHQPAPVAAAIEDLL